MITRSQHRTVLQIFIDDCSIGGYDDLSQLNTTSKLNQFLNIESSIDLAKIYDVVINDAGSAGMSATYLCNTKNFSTLR